MKTPDTKVSGCAPREDTVWKKIFRDLREFFRILFRLRFHPLDYKTPQEADTCTKVLLGELGIDYSKMTDHEIRKIFYYMHQTRMNSSTTYMSSYVKKRVRTSQWTLSRNMGTP